MYVRRFLWIDLTDRDFLHRAENILSLVLLENFFAFVFCKLFFLQKFNFSYVYLLLRIALNNWLIAIEIKSFVHSPKRCKIKNTTNILPISISNCIISITVTIVAWVNDNLAAIAGHLISFCILWLAAEMKKLIQAQYRRTITIIIYYSGENIFFWISCVNLCDFVVVFNLYFLSQKINFGYERPHPFNSFFITRFQGQC